MTESVRYTVDYYASGEAIWQDEYAPMVPAIGQGVHLKGVYYRVVDVWLNYEKHAPVNFGINVFLKETATPGVYVELDASYYGAGGGGSVEPALPAAVARDADDSNPLTMGF